MPRDAFDPGEDGSYPAWPRRPDGKPAGCGFPVTTPEEREAEEKMPSGLCKQRVPETGEIVVIDITPRHPDGTPIVPPTIPPTP